MSINILSKYFNSDVQLLYFYVFTLLRSDNKAIALFPVLISSIIGVRILFFLSAIWLFYLLFYLWAIT